MFLPLLSAVYLPCHATNKHQILIIAGTDFIPSMTYFPILFALTNAICLLTLLAGIVLSECEERLT